MEDNETLMYQFPRYIDKPRLIGVFEMDEFFISFGVIVLVYMVSFLIPSADNLYVMLSAIALGVFSGVMYKRFKKGRPDGYTLQVLYRKGIFSQEDDKKALLKYPYLRRLKMIPYGFTTIFYN